MPRLFTLDEANAFIPRLREYFEHLAVLRGQARTIQGTLAHLEQKGHSNGRDLATVIRETQQQLESVSDEMKSILEKITAIGCEVKDVEAGLVDFPADRDGRTVYLCWRLGEDQIRFWHEVSTGFAGRQPIDE